MANPLYKPLSKTYDRHADDLNVWELLRDDFHRQALTLLRVYEDKGSVMAQIMHAQAISALEDENAWGQMFSEACFREPEQISLIMEARKAFLEFLSLPLASAEDNAELLSDLLEIQEELRRLFRKLKTAINEGKHHPDFKITLDMPNIEHILAPFAELARTSPHAQNLIENIRETYNDIRIIAHDYLNDSSKK